MPPASAMGGYGPAAAAGYAQARTPIHGSFRACALLARLVSLGGNSSDCTVSLAGRSSKSR
eukprot:1728419-Pleurochrysis_carterae.AAC.1